ncbi:baeRF11 domain-containing protein [Meridianimarinicoccus sp. RP-17]|uniref:baeRF11 domain-containing protein n=1 Tax=Meridianimarinicoccus zhengii TaxID=2056810 RepID=UPI000DABCA3A|nr:hypothetical protein [Phycocomes zhengii]
MLHIDLPTRAEIDLLAAHRGAPAISIYLPTTPVTQDTQSDRIALKNALREAIGQLQAVDTAKRTILPIEDAVEALVEDDDFWATQANGLAVFVAPDFLRTFRLPSRLETMVQVSDRFHLKPLLRSVTFPQDAYVLAISVGDVRLIEVSADLPADTVKVPGLPSDFNDALGKKTHLEQGTMGKTGNMSENALMNRYCRAVDSALRPLLAGQERPLIVAASEPLASIYRAVSSYPHTTAQVIAGSVQRTPDHELATAARKILDERHADRIASLADLYRTRENQGRATGDIAQAARAATFGAIDTLVVDMNDVVPGTVDEETGAVTFADAAGADSYGIIDEIVSRAMKSGARIFSARKADIPGGGSLAAILRFPV